MLRLTNDYAPVLRLLLLLLLLLVLLLLLLLRLLLLLLLLLLLRLLLLLLLLLTEPRTLSFMMTSNWAPLIVAPVLTHCTRQPDESHTG